MNHSCRIQKFISGLIFFLLVSIPFFQVPDILAKESSYRILITNDDGIDSEGIEALVREFKRSTDVVVAAPVKNMSGSSHSTTIKKGITQVTPYFKNGKLFGYGVDGTPADATRFGILELGKKNKFDLVISGINKGPNVGSVSHISGTVGAAMEALSYGIPAIAVSQSHEADYKASARYTAKIVAQLRKHGIPPGVLLSINVPSGKIKGAVSARMGSPMLKFTEFKKVTNTSKDVLRYRPIVTRIQVEEEETDTSFFQDNYITITPLKFDWTDYKALSDLSKWTLWDGKK